MSYGIAHLSVWTVTFGQKSNPNFNVGSIQAEAGYPYLSENFRALASDQEKNYSLAFSYVELTLCYQYLTTNILLSVNQNLFIFFNL